MTKFSTVLISAILALLLVAIGFFLVRDKPTPTAVAVGSVADPSYEAAIAPPESLVPAPVQRIGGTSGAEGRVVAITSGDQVVRSRDGEGQSTVDKSQTQVGGIDGADHLSLSADPARAAGEEGVGEIVEEPIAVQLPRTYTVRRGDTLASIAERYYGSPALWRPIRDANRDVLGKGVRQISIGAQLTIPPLGAPPIKEAVSR